MKSEFPWFGLDLEDMKFRKIFHWVQFRNNIKHQDNKNESLLHKYMDLEVNHNKLKIKIKDVCNYKVHHET